MLAERSTTRLPDGQAGLARAEAAAAASTQALPGAELARSSGRQALVLLSRLWVDVHLRWLVALVLVALALRIAWVATVTPDPLDGRFDDTVFPER